MTRRDGAASSSTRPFPFRVLAVVFAASVTVLAAGACGGDDLSAEVPPWGLDGVDMPDTEPEVAAVMASLPDEVDGVPRHGGQSPNEVTPGPVKLVAYGEDHWTITAVSREEVQRWDPANETPADFVVHLASGGFGIGTIEASATDPGGHLMWVAMSVEVEDFPESARLVEDPVEFYGVTWAKPDGSWLFEITTNSEAGRLQLAQAFVAAARG